MASIQINGKWRFIVEKCSQCGVSGRRGRKRDSLCCVCRHKEYRAKHPEKHAAWAKKYYPSYYQKNKPILREKNHAHALKREYGISSEAYDALLVMQDWKCAICCAGPEPNRKMSVDHDHGTGVVRGLLCRNCNSGLGYFYDNPKFLRNAILYIAKDDMS